MQKWPCKTDMHDKKAAKKCVMVWICSRDMYHGHIA
jgi:hypothetical protein